MSSARLSRVFSESGESGESGELASVVSVEIALNSGGQFRVFPVGVARAQNALGAYQGRTKSNALLRAAALSASERQS